MLAITNELKLTIMMVSKGDEVPEAMKTKALQDLNLTMMSYKEDDAEFVVLSMLEKAIKEEDLELLKKATSYMESMYKVNSTSIQDELDPESVVLYEISTKVVDKFVKETESEEQIRSHMIQTLANNDLLPVYYEPGFMVFYAGMKNELIACSVNGSYNKRQLANMIDTINTEILEAIHNFSEKSSVKFRFADLSYKRKSGKQFELKLEEY